jgi:hypothetical protein
LFLVCFLLVVWHFWLWGTDKEGGKRMLYERRRS